MASPIGHGLAAVAAGWLVAKPPSSRREFLIQSGTLALIGVMPDLDLLINRHSAETHSVGVAAVVASLAAVARLPVAQTRGRIWLAVFLAWMTHPLLDAFTADSSVPVGIMIWWPFSSAHYHSGIVVFDSIYRRWWLPGFLEHNLIAALKEFVIVGPVAAVVWWVRRTNRTRGPSFGRDGPPPPSV
ncbi:MAG TPA: metal-dependent hydrolase [Vicinamibacterales bacterium]|nr:metal-dependent hydrolase [Vicinamibacterales bacterium]